MRLLKIILILGSGVPHEKQKGIFNILVKERSFEFDNTKHKIDINNWVYKFSGSENRPIDFKNYQLQWKVSYAQVKSSTNSENLLNETKQIVYLYQSKEIIKKVYNNIIKSTRMEKWILYL